MKSLLTLAAVVCAFALHAAPQATPIKNGANIVSTPGEIVAIDCMTIDASQVVTAKVVTAITEYTNAYKTVTVPHTRYDFTITNYDGNAAVATNVLDTFKYSDWTRGSTNLILGAVKPSRTNIAEQVANGKLPKAIYTKETVIGTGTASDHYLRLTPASTFWFFGGEIDISCGTDDLITVLVK